MRVFKPFMLLLVSVTLSMTGFAHVKASDGGPPGTDHAIYMKDVCSAMIGEISEVTLASQDVGVLNNPVTEYVFEAITPERVKVTSEAFADRHRRSEVPDNILKLPTKKISNKFADYHRRR